MHIGMVIPEFPGQTHVFFWREICALRALGTQVSIISTRRPKEPCRHEFAAAAIRETHYLFPPKVVRLAKLAKNVAHRSTVKYLASLGGPAGQIPKRLALTLSAGDLLEVCRSRSIDHLHFHSFADAAHVAAICRLAGGPTFSLHLHGDLPVYGAHHAQKVQRALFVAAAARSGKEEIERDLGFPADRTFVMRMGVDTSRFPVLVDQAHADPVHIATVGRLNFTKGHRFGLRALRKVIDRGIAVRYSIAGSGPHQAEIEAEIRQLNLQSHVSLLGSLSEADVVALLGKAHVFLLPSVGLGEASPVAVMEAMAAGLCVVCSRIGGTADMIDQGTDGFLTDQEDVDGIAETLAKLASDASLRVKIANAARRRAETEFDAKVLAERMLSTITSLQASSR